MIRRAAAAAEGPQVGTAGAGATRSAAGAVAAAVIAALATAAQRPTESCEVRFLKIYVRTLLMVCEVHLDMTLNTCIERFT